MEGFKKIINKLPEDIFKIVCSYALPSEKYYIFKQFENSYVVKVLSFSKINDNIDYAINNLKNKLQKEAIILRSLINNDLPSAEKDYDANLKKALKQIIKNIVPKSMYVNDKKLNEIISVYVRNIDIVDINMTNNKKINIIWLLNKIRNYKLFRHLIFYY